ncbi:hypothetical protein CQ048_24495 [Pseudomonas trivialis]|nr:hypothetical protein CQ048_24495 [Pseudomonas trivialis]PRB20925.1 hypothetical protein CQ041_24360 [Pseudomonas sp. MYb60]
MLYPIELLGQMTAIGQWAAMDGVHVNHRVGFCHVVRRLFECRPILARSCAALPRKHGLAARSCKMHSPRMPSLQIATRTTFKVDSNH